MEHKSKGESLEKCQAELKKLRRKSQGSKNPSKYGDKEMQVSQSCSLNANKLNLLLSTFFFGGLVTHGKWKPLTQMGIFLKDLNIYLNLYHMTFEIWNIIN